MKIIVYRLLALCCLLPMESPLLQAQTFALLRHTDSLYVLTLGSDRWVLPYPVYQFQTGDVDGDDVEEALVGVIKSTRFDTETARRLFIFKNKNGHVRPLWMGSRLGGRLEDFCWVPVGVRSLESGRNGRYAVVEYAWEGFGMGFVRYLVRDTDLETACQFFHSSIHEPIPSYHEKNNSMDLSAGLDAQCSGTDQ